MAALHCFGWCPEAGGAFLYLHPAASTPGLTVRATSDVDGMLPGTFDHGAFRDDDAGRVRLLGGRPAPHTTILVVGEAEQPQPMGTPGRLCFQGSFLHLGYGSHLNGGGGGMDAAAAAAVGQRQLHNTGVRAVMWGDKRLNTAHVNVNWYKMQQ